MALRPRSATDFLARAMSSATVYVSRQKPARPRVFIAADASAPGTTKFRPDIEGLRAVSVVLVVLYHAGIAPFTGGYIGVDVFFVISGFLITRMLFGELETTRRINVARFYARRATRLLPASTLVVAATVLASRIWLPPTRLPSIDFDALSSLGYVVNFRMAAQGINYLSATAAPSPLQHLWSLSVEEQFYLVWPTLLVVCSLAWRWRQNTFNRWTVVTAVVAIALGSFTLGVWQTAQAAPWAYFGSQTRAWELAVGALVALLAEQLSAMRRSVAAILTWLGLAGVVASAVIFTAATPFPGVAAALPVLSAAALIAGGCAAPAGGAVIVLGVRPFQWIGKLSYGWYLWHWPALMIVPIALGINASPAVNLAIAVAALGPAVVSYYLVENPIRHSRPLTVKAWKGIGLGVAASSLVAGVTVTLLALSPSLAGIGQATDTRAALDASANPSVSLQALLTAAATDQEVPRNLTPKLTAAAADSPILYADGCHLGFTATWPTGPCTFGDVTATKTVVLFGDSH
ncbi:MAG TPA: acyltransferase, partial [Micromonosporaceae bacterium]